MEELKHRLEALAKKIALKEAEILDLRNEVQTLRALMNTIIDEQIRVEEDAAKQAAELASQAAIDEQKQKEAMAEEVRLAAEHEAKLLEEEARIAQAKAQEALRLAQEEAEKQALEQAEAKEQAEANARAEAEATAARVAELERLRAEEEAKRLADQQAAREKAEKEAEAKAAEKANEEANQRVPEQDHEAIMRTIENMANGVNIKPSRADRFQDKQTLGDKVSRSRLLDIKKAIGLNEKFLYANELFNGDMSAFSQAVDELNHVESEHDANRIMQEELADKYHWDEEDETVIAFKSLVSRRFV